MPTLAPLALALLAAAPTPPPALSQPAALTVKALVAKHGEPERARIERGVAQAASLWRPADGDGKAFQAFCEAQFLPKGPALDAGFSRLEAAIEALEGNGLEMGRTLRSGADLDLGPLQPLDPLLAAFDPTAHFNDDLFDQKIAFAVLLNFPLTTLDERVAQGETWTTRQWAEARLADRFSMRVPAAVMQGIARASAEADAYVAGYNVWVHHVVDDQGARPFPKGKRLLSHWNLRDELKAWYGQPDGVVRQRAIAKVMERIVTQTIPAAVIDDPTVDWNPWTNAVAPAPAAEIENGKPPRAKVDPAREADVRFARILGNFRAARAMDPYSPAAPTQIARGFLMDRELPEARVVATLEEVLGAPEIARIGKLVSTRLGRPLEPFDVWYPGFKAKPAMPEAELDKITRARYPTPAAFEKALPLTLQKLGFTPERAAFFAAHITVDPARGSGHALEAARRGDKPHLRTRVNADGMDYKGFNIAVHELGHNVEQVCSLYQVDSTLLRGVPNTAFTEALAFVFQARDLEVLGLPGPDAEARRLEALDRLWSTFEIAGVALVDLRMWHWMYDHPKATPAQLREATVGIAKEVWNRWYAPVLGAKDVPLLAIYSHMVNRDLYIPDYPLGHVIAAQIEAHMDARPANTLGAEFERMASAGRLSPDVWMKKATGQPVTARPMIEAAARALDAVAAR
ncbi:MAG: hypothetical protein QM704_27725 [Anaeromyxobacteraceae bacterium]